MKGLYPVFQILEFFNTPIHKKFKGDVCPIERGKHPLNNRFGACVISPK